LKIGICGNSNLSLFAEELDKLIKDTEIVTGDPKLWHKELKAPPQDLKNADMCIIALNWNALIPESYDYTWSDNFEKVSELFEKVCTDIEHQLINFRSHCKGTILLFTPHSPRSFSTGFITRIIEHSPWDLFCAHQKRFNTLCSSVSDCFPVDLDQITELFENTSVIDLSDDQSNAEHTSHIYKVIAKHCSSIIARISQSPIKCIVLDLDNTLWGGIIGESAVNSIQLDTKGAGKAYYSFQKELVKLHKQGVLLAVCSKNNTCDAMEMFETHPCMVLKTSMISSFRINWDNKPQNVFSIAKELNIGLDSLLFIDDSPSERELMRQTFPEIEVPELPSDPVLYTSVLRSTVRLWPLQLTHDDHLKQTFFSMDRLRRNEMNMEKSVEEFLRKSGLKLSIREANLESLPRITQLFSKTNQFNLTTIRYSQSQLEAIMSEKNTHLFYMSMTDNFGDYGIIAAALLRAGTIDSFLLSCRAFGKDAERAFLTYLVQFCKERGYNEINGRFTPTLKNAPSKDFYKCNGFVPAQSASLSTVWRFDLSQPIPQIPDWFELL